MKESGNSKSKQGRGLAAIGLTAGMVALFATLGGAGMAQNAGTAAEGQYGKKVTLCHKGKKTISVGKAAVPAHLRHGDTVGTCAAAKAKKAKLKAAKLKAAKAKAAKAKAAKAKAAKAKAADAKAGKSKGEKATPEAAKGKADPGKADPGKPDHGGSDKPNPGKGNGKGK